MQAPSQLERALAAQRGRLWGLCYRMSGCAADADDWLQDVFERALSQPPADLDLPLGPWLTRVAMNVCRDHLRRRKHSAYAGPWLPGPLESSDLWARLQGEQPSPEARYGQQESVSLAFLLAMEALTPNQRAVLLLRDVCDLSVRETAEALGLSEGAVKTTLHRARATLATRDAREQVPLVQHRRILEAFLVHLSVRNVDALKTLVADHVVEHNDGAGKYHAAQRPVRGLAKLIKFHAKIARPVRGVLLCSLNGQPAMLFELAPGRPRDPRRGAVWLRIDRRGRVVEVFGQVADRKLEGLPWERLRPVDAGLVFSMLRSAWSNPDSSAWRMPALRRALGATRHLPDALRAASQRRRRARRRRLRHAG